MAPQRDEIFKQKVNDCVQHIILQKFTDFHAIRSWNFRIFSMRWTWPRFYCATLYTVARVSIIVAAEPSERQQQCLIIIDCEDHNSLIIVL